MIIQKTKWDMRNAFESMKRTVERETAESKTYEFVESLIVKLGLSDSQAAEVANTTVEFVRKVRTTLEGKKNRSF